MGPGDRGDCRDAVDGDAKGAGDVDPGPFGVGGGPAGAPGQAGCPAQLTDQRLAFLIGLFGGGAIAGAVGGGELVIQFPDPVTIGVAGGGIQQRPGAGGSQPGAGAAVWASGLGVSSASMAQRSPA